MLLLSAVLAVNGSQASLPAPAENPWSVIVTRNVFALKEEPKPTTGAETNAPPPPSNVELLGIATIFGKQRVYLRTIEVGKPTATPPETFTLSIDEPMRNDVELVDVDEKGGIVKIKNRGVAQTINFKDNAAKSVAVAAAPAPGAPGAPGAAPGAAPASGIPMPKGAQGTRVEEAINRLRNLQRPVRATDGQSSTAMQPPGMYSGQAAAQPAAQPTPALSADEQMVMMEVERERTRDLVEQGKAPPLPPTVLQQMLNSENNQQSARPGGGFPGFPR